jgi:ADP-ribose pyrophosphatase
MDLTEKTLESTTIFEGKILCVQRDTALLPNGRTAVREVCRHPGGVAVLPMKEDGTVCLVRQYRYPFHQQLLELPAGKLDQGEDHYPAAVRELSEETGLQAGELIYLGKLYASPGFCDEVLHMYLGRQLKQDKSHPDEDEFLDVVTMPFGELVEQVMSGQICDAKTVATVLKVKLFLEREQR